MYTVKLRLGKKDAVLKQWIEYEKANDDNVSCAVSETLLYYICNGTYLRIANIPRQEIHELPDGYRSLSFRENTAVHQWLLKKEAEGQKVSSVVKRILKASITTLDEPVLILLSDDLCLVNDRKQGNIAFETEILRAEPIKEPQYLPEIGNIHPLENITEPKKISPSTLVYEEKEEEKIKTDEKDIQEIEKPARTEDKGKKRKKVGLIDNLMLERLNL